MVRVTVSQPDYVAQRLGEQARRELTCWGVIDTGASQTTVDLEKVIEPLGLLLLDAHEVHSVGSKAPISVNQYWGRIAFPDFPFAPRQLKLIGMPLAGPFFALIGMDLLADTRFSYDGRGSWFTWEPA